MEKAIYFDMDGTIADLYGVENWLNDLQGEKTAPYEKAKPLVNMNLLARYLNKLHKQGYYIGVISWTSKGGSAEYNVRVKTAKEKWLNTHLKSVKFDDVAIVPYGTPKSSVALIKNGLLFDDAAEVREEWRGIAFNVDNILPTLKALID